MTRELGFREFVAMVLLGYFGWAFFKNPTDETIIGALLMAFAGAWGFYLGGSKIGSDTAAKNAETVSDQAKANTGEPQPVTVVNPPGDPVQTTDAPKGDTPAPDARAPVGFGRENDR